VRTAGSRGSVAAAPAHDDELSPERAADIVWQTALDLAQYSPVTFVWLFDETRSAQELVSRVSAQLRSRMEEASQTQSVSNKSELPLSVAVVGYGSDLRWLVERPSRSPEDVAKKLDELRVDSGIQENLFTALAKVLDKFLDPRARRSSERLILGIVTDEMGDDWLKVDELVPRLRRDGVSVYVIGPPAALGKVQPLRDPPEKPETGTSAGTIAHRQGPESRYVELVPFERELGQEDLTLMDSGFGPFALEWICRAAGGTYLAIRPRRVEGYVGLQPDVWPSPYAPRFSRDIMQRYLPDYVTEDEYRRLLNENRAAYALHEAAKKSRISALQAPQLAFSAGNEAELNRVASTAQQQAALAIRFVDDVYNLLKDGEKDRPRLHTPRWQAAYDLALGQASLAKAQIDAYNSMLAKLKRGMSFRNPSSNTWILEPADEFPESNLERIAKRGQELLQQVVNDHPGTPWAMIAERALYEDVKASDTSPTKDATEKRSTRKYGWRWTEK